MEQRPVVRESPCQTCGVENLKFEAPPMFCSVCHSFITRDSMYHYYFSSSGTDSNSKFYFCVPCHDRARGDYIVVSDLGSPILKSDLELRRNDGEIEELWVKCDQCGTWEHQICALFNARMNNEYICTNCNTNDAPPPETNGVLGAKDLPATLLSDHLEHRLFRKLEQERLDRAQAQGQTYDQVPGVEGLVVRVVSSVDKHLQVKQQFLDLFRQQNFPTEFPYKSKAVLLFQKIEGVEVCLFGMYAQEYGSEAEFPNQRRVCLSYLDSVKYFRPEINAVTGESLRTFVYHEILIGYLEYCKKRGFASCYIWACPPSEGQHYIFYRRPDFQKMPNSDRLRDWFLSMLRKASEENIVVDITNIYDHFFVSPGECKAMITAARLPYFNGDFWPGTAEDVVPQLRQELPDVSGNTSEDLLLMHKLGEIVHPMKEDFIMVHLQHACDHCRVLMVSGNRWVCDRCENFQLCDECYEAELKRKEQERHPIDQSDKHAFNPVEINEVPADTKDKDEILENEFFDSRRAFVGLCMGNQIQYDTLRRAKHSSMMVLYHLHNSSAPPLVTTCSLCPLDIDTGRGWRCEVCSDFDVCDACYQNNDVNNPHPHRLTSHSSIVDPDTAQNQEARKTRFDKFRKMLDSLVHGSLCRSPECRYLNCRQVKEIFHHAMKCRIRASGGCRLCRRMWHFLELHARACRGSECPVPRCREMKEYISTLQRQSESRRRAGVMRTRLRADELMTNAG